MNDINLLEQANPFLENIYKDLASDGIDVSNYNLDHICYRVETIERYVEVKNHLSNTTKELTEFDIRDRKVATFKLISPIVFRDKKISCIELASPRKDLFFPEGFEHAEFIIKENFDDFMKKYPKVSFNTEALDKKTNPELIRQYKGIAVKFHHYSLEYTIVNLQ